MLLRRAYSRFCQRATDQGQRTGLARFDVVLDGNSAKGQTGQFPAIERQRQRLAHGAEAGNPDALHRVRW